MKGIFMLKFQKESKFPKSIKKPLKNMSQTMDQTMDKYYVRCGELDRVVMADSPEDAAWRAIMKAEGETLWHFCYIDEKGFRGPVIDSTEPHLCIFDSCLIPQWVIAYADIIGE